MEKRYQQFRRKVLAYYRKHGRDLLWRQTRDPYAILVSEIMLQQTQVSRVLPKYEAFLKKFPTLASLARAKRIDVLRLWQGLGYNRRAVALHELAKQVKQLPSDQDELARLPGIGPYTAAAIAAFAFDLPVVMIETNIRRAVINEFYENENKIHDRVLYLHLQKLLPRKNIRTWYYALMDYGAMLKTRMGRANPNKRSKHYAKQSKFEGSGRQLRGELVRLGLRYGHKLIIDNIRQLEREGLIG